jgi:hypothetical protein
MDLSKLKAIRDWSEDLVDELNRGDVLPCKNLDRIGDCISRQKNKLLEEMRPTRMCARCRTRWYASMAAKGVDHVYSAKTENRIEEPSWT